MSQPRAVRRYCRGSNKKTGSTYGPRRGRVAGCCDAAWRGMHGPWTCRVGAGYLVQCAVRGTVHPLRNVRRLSEASRDRRASASPLCARMRARQGLSCRRRSLRTHLRTAWRPLASGGELRPLSTQCCSSLSRAVPPRARAREAAHQTKRVRMASAGAQSTRRRARSLVVVTGGGLALSQSVSLEREFAEPASPPKEFYWRLREGCTVLPSLPWVVCFLSFFLAARIGDRLRREIERGRRPRVGDG